MVMSVITDGKVPLFFEMTAMSWAADAQLTHKNLQIFDNARNSLLNFWRSHRYSSDNL